MISNGPKIPIMAEAALYDTYVSQGNLMLRALQALLQANVINLTTSTPPGSPADGDTYVVGSAPTGAWTSQANSIAYWTLQDPAYPSGAWEFWTPLSGWMVGNQADGKLYVYYSGTWAAVSGGGSSVGLYPNGLNEQSGTTYVLQASDNGKLIAFTNAGDVVLTINSAFTNTFQFGAAYSGDTSLTISSSTVPVDGVTGDVVTLNSLEGVQMVSDSTQFFTDGQPYVAPAITEFFTSGAADMSGGTTGSLTNVYNAAITHINITSNVLTVTYNTSTNWMPYVGEPSVTLSSLGTNTFLDGQQITLTAVDTLAGTVQANFTHAPVDTADTGNITPVYYIVTSYGGIDGGASAPASTPTTPGFLYTTIASNFSSFTINSTDPSTSGSVNYIQRPI